MLERSLSRAKGISELDLSVIDGVKPRMTESSAPAAPEVVAASVPVSQSRLVSLREKPGDIVGELPVDWVGQTLVIHAADPQSPQVQNWVAQLRTALPPDTRITLQPSVDLDAETLQLVKP